MLDIDAIIIKPTGGKVKTNMKKLLLLLLLICPTAHAETVSWFSSQEACTNSKCLTAYGTPLQVLEAREPKEGYFCASWAPEGTKFTVSANGKTLTCISKDRGPNKRLKRKLDLSKRAFSYLADPKIGLLHATAKS